MALHATAARPCSVLHAQHEGLFQLVRPICDRNGSHALQQRSRVQPNPIRRAHYAPTTSAGLQGVNEDCRALGLWREDCRWMRVVRGALAPMGWNGGEIEVVSRLCRSLFSTKVFRVEIVVEGLVGMLPWHVNRPQAVACLQAFP